jgi:tRNA U34 2-thiouridine synthase MnmA/TrmU
MSQKENMLHAQLERKGDKLEFRDPIKKKLYSELIQNMEEGQIADLFLDVNCDDGTLAQLARAKASIRAIAKETGNLFEDVQLDVKEKAGLCFVKRRNGKDFLMCKSMGDCSKTEMGLIIEAINEIGRFVGINFD